MKDAAPTPFSSSHPLHILIAGAGIGGLTASLALRRHGHHITVFEQSRLANEIGAAINIAPNCNRILRRLGVFLEDHGAVDCKGFAFWDSTPKEIMYMDRSQDPLTCGYPYHMMHRAHLHKALKERALKVGVQLKTASRVVSVRQDEEGATVMLEGGQEVAGDVVIGADGVHSLTRRHLTAASSIVPTGSGMSGFRFLVPTSTLSSDPLTAPFVSRPGVLIRVAATIPNHHLLMYPCVNNTIMNCMYSLPTSEVEVPRPSESTSTFPSTSTWTNESSKAQMLQHASPAFSPAPLSVLQKADADGIRLWELLDMEPLPTWVRGRLALMGDAAHPFTPWRGQGGAQAIEDAASLGVMLGEGVRKEQIAGRLELYMRARRERAELIQDSSRKGSPLKESEERAKVAAGGGKVSMGGGQAVDRDLGEWLLGYDEWGHSEDVLRKALAEGEVGQEV